MAEKKKTYLLFDIDGTLIHAGGAGRRALTSAMAACGVPEEGLQSLSFAGRTDRQIINGTLRDAGCVKTLAPLSRRVEAYYLDGLDQLLGRESLMRVCPWARELLEACRDRPDLELALLTGNVPRGAEIKLSHAGLWDYFSWGVYGDFSEVRSDLAREARRRIEANDPGLDPRRIWVIGDTAADVQCGKAIGATTVGLTSGFEPEASVRAAVPDHLLPDLKPLFTLLKLIEPVGG
jgi:phosphoglycolate phosphatase